MKTRSAGLLALLLAGCLPRLTQPDPEDVAWQRVRSAHTRSVNEYNGLAVSAFASATWESPEVRAARVRRLATWRKATADEETAMSAQESADAARFDEFTVSFFTPDRADNDLDSRRTRWRIALVPGDTSPDRMPVEVTALRIDSQLRALYPTIGDFDSVYRIRFARAGELPAQFTFRIAGPRGTLDFPFPVPATEPAASR